LFDPARKKPIPMLPQRIAVITSPTGAAVRDILNVLGRRFQGLSLQIYPVRVQGATAGREIAAAIKHLSRWKLHDVVLICRGGGSLEDLWAFNEEIVARAVADCEVPTISGVGHETDFTICDFVADLRAPTPSAAAEIVVRAKDEICMHVDAMTRRIRYVVESRVRNLRHELRHLSSSDRLGVVVRRVALQRDRLERRRVMLFRMLDARAKTLRRRLIACDEPLAKYPARIQRDRQHLRAVVSTLQAVSPLSVLSRGYAIAFSRTKRGRKPILDSNQVQVGDPIEVQLKKGRINATVDSRTLGVESVWPEIENG
jgi:exodeoxyribonuclease VII large subunit